MEGNQQLSDTILAHARSRLFHIGMEQSPDTQIDEPPSQLHLIVDHESLWVEQPESPAFRYLILNSEARCRALVLFYELQTHESLDFRFTELDAGIFLLVGVVEESDKREHFRRIESNASEWPTVGRDEKFRGIGEVRNRNYVVAVRHSSSQ